LPVTSAVTLRRKRLALMKLPFHSACSFVASYFTHRIRLNYCYLLLFNIRQTFYLFTYILYKIYIIIRILLNIII
ncbi:hypothetical protein, partial [Enterococcus faecium]